MSIQVPQSVLEVLDRAIIDGNSLQLTGSLDRKLYVDVNKVLEAAGGKWNRKAKAHIFDGDAVDTIEPILLTGEYTRTKQDFGQFDSPPEVVARVIDLALIKPGYSILEPSAGIGNIAVAAANAGGDVMAYELDPKRCEKLVAALRGAPGSNMVIERDFLAFPPSPTYDRVVMNPPFAKQMDIKHVMHAHAHLKKGGLLVAVMSASVLFRDNATTANFRSFVQSRDGSIERLPDGSFKGSGTSVNTCVAVMPA
jgi:predicted RNA methylase